MARRLRWLAAVAALAASPQAITAQVASDEGVREALDVVEVWLEAQRAYNQIPAVSAAVVHDQEVVWSTAQGVAHRETGAPATEETLYSICSISKLFTAVALMQLRDRGLVDLRDPVQKHLPWFTLEQRYEGSPPVTLEGILTHSAGLPRESAHPYWTGPDFPFPTTEEVVEGVEDQETLYPARQYFQYSNLGLTLAGEIVAARSGSSYHDYVRRNVLEPLGMHDTFTDIPEEHRGGRLATGYGAPTRDGTREKVAFFQAKGIAPAAGFASTALDLARFAAWQFRLSGSAEEVLHAHTLDEMHRVHYVDPEWDTFWGLGFSVNRRNDETFVGHGGSCPGFRTQLVLHMGEKIAVVFLANTMANAGTYAYGIHDLVADAIIAAVEETGDGPAVATGRSAAPAGTAAERNSTNVDGGAQETEQELDLTPYLGTYSGQPWGSETAVVKWKGGLSFLGLPTSSPAQSVNDARLKHDEGDVFYRVRSDGERGEDVIFERNADGVVTGYRVHGNLSPRIR